MKYHYPLHLLMLICYFSLMQDAFTFTEAAPVATIQKLKLTSMCSDDPAATRRWRIINPNDFDVQVAWQVYGTNQKDTVIAPNGASYFETVTIGGPNTTLIRWFDGEKWKQTVKASGGAQCISNTIKSLKLDHALIEENQPVGTVIGNFNKGESYNGWSFQLVEGDGSSDNEKVFVEGHSLLANQVFDFESNSALSIRVRGENPSGTQIIEQVFSIQIIDNNEPPLWISLSSTTIQEFNEVNALIGLVTAYDPDENTELSWEMIDIDSTSAFKLVAPQKVVANKPFNHTEKPSYRVQFKVTDQHGLSIDSIFHITVEDIPDSPNNISLDVNTIEEHQPVGTFIANILVNDPNPYDSITVEFVEGTGDLHNDFFHIKDGKLFTQQFIDFHAFEQLLIRVRATDLGGDYLEATFAINVQNVINSPSNITLSNQMLSEFEPTGTLIGNLIAEDKDTLEAHIFSLVDGAGSDDNASFTIENQQLFSNQTFNHTQKNQYTIRVQVTDIDGATFEKILGITIKDMPDPPSKPSLSQLSLDEHQAIGHQIGTFSAQDINLHDTHTFELIEGKGFAGKEYFFIDGKALFTSRVFDYHQDSILTIKVRVTDLAGSTAENSFPITVNNVINPPTSLALSNTQVDEFNQGETFIGKLTGSDPDSLDALTYSFTKGANSADNAFFKIRNDSLFGATYFNYLTKSNYQILIAVSDPDGATFEKPFVVNVKDIEDPPFNLGIDTSSVLEQMPMGTKIGTFYSEDLDSLDIHTYHLVNSSQGNDNAYFYINNGALYSNASFDYHKNKALNIFVEARDRVGSKTQEAITIEVIDQQIAPSNISLSLFHPIYEKSDIINALGTLTAEDDDQTTGHSFELVFGEGSADNASFRIDGDELYSNIIFVHDIQAQYTIRIKATDDDNQPYEKVILLDIEPTDGGGSGDYTQVANNLPFSFTSTVSLGDFDKDGDNDLFVGNRFVPSEIFWNNGYGKFLSSDTIFDRSNIYASYAVDIDHDDDIDIIAANWHNPSIIWLNDGEGHFTSYEPGFSIGSLLNFPIADFDNDGDLDIIEVVYGKENFIWWNDGSGIFTKGHAIASPYTYTLIHGDYDGDEDIDLYEVRHNDSHHVWLNDGTGSFTEKVDGTTNTAAVFDAAVIDVELDGDLDLLFPNNYGRNLLALNNGDGTFAQAIEVMSDVKSHHIAVGDLNNDGYPDAIVANSKSPCEVYLNDGQGNLELSKSIGMGDSRRIALGTLDPDSDLDAAIGNHDSSNTIWLNESRPTGILLSNYQLQENKPAHSFIATLTSFDPDTEDKHVYQFGSGTGDDDNHFFTISGDSLFTKSPFDFESKAAYSIRLVTIDQSDLSHEQVVKIRVQDVDETPEMDAVADQYIAFNGSMIIALTGIGIVNKPNAKLELKVLIHNEFMIDSFNIAYDGISHKADLYIEPSAFEFGSSLITLTLQDTAGIHQYTDEFVVFIEEPNITTTNVAFCSPETLSVSAEGAYDFYWYDTVDSQTPIYKGFTFTSLFEKSDTLYVAATAPSGNETATRTPVMIEIYDVPALSIELSANNLLATSDEYSDYQWYLNGEMIEGANSWFYEALVNGIYTVMAVTEHGCAAISAEISINAFETATITQGEVIIEYYPNPTINQLTVSVNTASLDDTKITVLDNAGNPVISITPLQKIVTLDVSSLLTGVYFLKVEQPEGIGVRKFLKN